MRYMSIGSVILTLKESLLFRAYAYNVAPFEILKF